MRTIKFRAWDGISLKMWDEVWFDQSHIYFGWDDKGDCPFATMPRWDTNPIMQFTGLLDKNGKEIYEGDILHSYSELFSGFGQYPTGKFATTIYQVLWVDDGWGHKTLKSKTQVIGHESRGLKVMASLTEVIGNIFEHPELLKEEK